MWDGRLDPRRLKTSSSTRGKHVSTPPSIPSSFHVSPPFQPSPSFSSPRHPPLPSSPSFPAPSPPPRHHSLYPINPPSSCPPHFPSYILTSSVDPPLHHSSSFPVPALRPTPTIQPSRHPPLPSSPTPRPSPPLHPTRPPAMSSCPSPADHRGVFVPQELHRRYEAAPESTKTKALQTVIEMKVNMFYLIFYCIEVLI